MEAGKLNHRITIQTRRKTRAPSGQPLESWEDLCTVWAEVRCTNSKTVDADGAVQHEGLYKFFIRHRGGIPAEARVKWNDGIADRYFYLVGPPADWSGDRTGLTLITKELV